MQAEKREYKYHQDLFRYNQTIEFVETDRFEGSNIMLKVTAVFLVSLLVVQGLQIPFEYKTVKANAVSQNGNNENVVDKHGLLVGK